MSSELSFIDRKIITADIRFLKRKLDRESSEVVIDYDTILQQLMRKYYKVTSLALWHSRLTVDEANGIIMTYKAEIPKIFDKEFGR